MKRQIKKYFFLYGLIFLWMIFWGFYFRQNFNFEILKTHHQELKFFLEHHFLKSIIIYSSLYVGLVSLAAPGVVFMAMTGGFLFGQWIGTLATLVSETIGAGVLFMSVKFASEKIQIKKTWIKKMKKGFQKNAFFYLLTLRFIPIFPFFAVNLTAAFFQVPFWIFICATFLGIIPGTVIYVSMGVALEEIIKKSGSIPNLIWDPKIWLALFGLGLLVLTPVLYQYYHNYHKKKLKRL